MWLARTTVDPMGFSARDTDLGGNTLSSDLF